MSLISSAHKSRIITGLILAAVSVSCLALGGIWLQIFVTAAAIIALFEFYSMFWEKNKNIVTKAVGLFAGAGIVLCARPGEESAALLFTIFGLVCFYAAMSFLADYGKGNDYARIEEHAIMPLGIIYIPMTLQIAMHLTLIEQLIVIVAAVASDTGAYYAGTYFGKRKIWPRISPKKSWEGAAGGLILCISMTTLIALFAQLPEVLKHVSIFSWIFLAILLNVASVLGDFFESAIKRAAQVKDSSDLLPGHGGFLDRMDSIIFALPAYALVRFLMFSPAQAVTRTITQTITM